MFLISACEDPAGGSHYSEEAFTVLFTGASLANKKSFCKNNIKEIIIFQSSKNNYYSYDYVKNNTNHIVNKDNEENIAEKFYFYDGKKASQK